VVAAVGAEAAVYLRVSKEVALEQEEKAKAGLERAREAVRKSRGIMSAPNWKDKVKAEVREAEEKRLRDNESEVAHLEEQIKEFEKLRLE
jgi:valyl-tRNA synthetase